MRRKKWMEVTAVTLVALMASLPMYPTGAWADEGGGGESGSEGSSESEGDAAAAAAPASEKQAAYQSPVNHFGAFTTSIPLAVPPAFPGATPELALTYASNSGEGIAGVGWNLPTPVISINRHEGARPPTLQQDWDRSQDRDSEVAPDWIERYLGDSGLIAVREDSGQFEFAYNPNNDLKIEPVADENGHKFVNGEVSAWQVTEPRGRSLRYGHELQSSLRAHADNPGAVRDVATFLDLVETPEGNQMRYFWEHYPDGRVYRQPVLRAIEYGIPADNLGSSHNYVVKFQYKEGGTFAPSYTYGTRIDTGMLLESVCVYGDTYVERRSRTVTDWGGRSVNTETFHVPSDEVLYCYNFEYTHGWTGRPLLSRAVTTAHDGSELDEYLFTYKRTGEALFNDGVERSVFQRAVDGDDPDIQPSSFPVVATLDEGDGELAEHFATRSLSNSAPGVTRMTTDLDGDGLVDVLFGSPTGEHEVMLGSPSGFAAGDPVDNPLRAHAEAATLEVRRLEAPETLRRQSDCWNHFNADIEWSAGTGLSYAWPLLAAPRHYWDIQHDSGWDRHGFFHMEKEEDYLALGGLQFLSQSVNAPYPGLGTGLYDFIDERETFGAAHQFPHYRAAYSPAISDCTDAPGFGTFTDLDYCWNAGTGGSGLLGADLDCFDYAGARWFTDEGDGLEFARSTNWKIWDFTDVDGDGLGDWLFSAYVFPRDADGNLRDTARNVNDAYVAFGNGEGWDSPVVWPIPDKSNPTAGVHNVKGSGVLSVGTSLSDAGIESHAIGFNACGSVSASGFGGSVTPIVGQASIPSFSFSSQPVMSNLIGAGKWHAGMAIQATTGTIGSKAMNAVSTAQAWYQGGGPTFATACRKHVLGKRPEMSTLSVAGFGNILKDVDDASSQLWQGWIDIDGDGRPDLVSARWADVPRGRSNKGELLYYHNHGAGFDAPVILNFDGVPVHGSGHAADGFQSRNSTSVRWGDLGQSWGEDEQVHGFADLNADGMLDFVTTYGHDDDVEPGDDVAWRVHFFDGQGFTKATKWNFEGGWDAPPGCAAISARAQPYLSKSVWFQWSDTTTLTEPSEGASRQVQGLYDLNGDGRPDYWYVEPSTEGSELANVCNYVPSRQDMRTKSGFLDIPSIVSDGLYYNVAWDFESLTSPYELNTRLMARLNTGSGFGEANEWGDGSVLPPGGGSLLFTSGADGIFKKVGETSNSAVSQISDLDADGVQEVAVLPRADSDEYVLYPLGFGDADLLESVRGPLGATTDVTYRWETQPGSEMGRGMRVVESITVDDAVGHRFTRSYTYGEGLYDRFHREHRGFQQVFEFGEGDGYTVSRFVPLEGFEGRLFCRAVVVSDDGTSAAELTQSAAGSEQGNPAVQGDPDKFAAMYERGSPAGDPNLGGPLESEGLTATTPDTTPITENEQQARYDSLLPINERVSPSWLDVDPPPADAAREVPALDTQASTASAFTGTSTSALGNTSLHGGCSSNSTGTTAGTTVGCGTGTVDLTSTLCWDPEEGERVLKEDLFLWSDESPEPAIVTPRLKEALSRLYDGSADPLETRVTMQYDGHGNVTERHDHADTSTPEDDLITSMRYVAADLVGWRVGYVWEEVQRNHLGHPLKKTTFAYDGNRLMSGGAATAGHLTYVRNWIGARKWTGTQMRYNRTGTLRWVKDANLDRTEYRYHTDFPWLRIAEWRDGFAELPSGARAPVTHMTETQYHWADTPEYHLMGLPSAIIDANGQSTSVEYDAHRRPTTTTRPLDGGTPTTTVSYQDSILRGVSERAHRGGGVFTDTQTTFDGLGRKWKVEGTAPTNRGGHTQVVAAERVYDNDGRVTQAYQPRFAGEFADTAAETRYDVLGRPTAILGPDGSATVHEYDRRTTRTTLPGGRCLQVVRDGLDETTTYYGPLCLNALRTDGVRYDASGRVVSRTDNDGNTWEFEHDWLGRVTASHDPNGFSNYAVYDDVGNVIATYGTAYLDGTGNEKRAVGIRYDEFGRPLERTEYSSASGAETGSPTGNVERRTRWSYDLGPMPGAHVICSGHSHATGRPVRIDHYEDHGTGLIRVTQRDFCYDARGRISDEALTITDGGVGADTYRYRYAYTNTDEVESVEIEDVSLGDIQFMTTHRDASGSVVQSYNDVGTVVSSASYLADGRLDERVLGGLLQESRCYSQGPSGPRLHRAVAGDVGLPVTCGGDASADVVDDRYGSFRVLQNTGYTFDDAGWLVDREVGYRDPVSRTLGFFAHSYGYDDLGQLTSETWNRGHGDVTESYGYDDVGNLTAMAGVSQHFGSDTFDTSVASSGPHQINSTAAGDRFTYDLAGRVATWTSRNGSTYEYRRHADGKLVDVVKDGAPAARHGYNEQGTKVFVQSVDGVSHHALHGYRVNDVTSWFAAPSSETQGASSVRRYDPGFGASMSFKLSDPLGSTTMLVDPASGEPTQVVRYAPFGAVRERHDVSGYSTDYLYNGKQQDGGIYDADDAVYDYGFRDYNALVGRWMAPDDTFVDAPNLYTYVRNAPVRRSDPTGHSSILPLLLLRCPEEAAKPATPTAYVESTSASSASLDSMLYSPFLPNEPSIWVDHSDKSMNQLHAEDVARGPRPQVRTPEAETADGVVTEVMYVNPYWKFTPDIDLEISVSTPKVVGNEGSAGTKPFIKSDGKVGQNGNVKIKTSAGELEIGLDVGLDLPAVVPELEWDALKAAVAPPACDSAQTNQNCVQCHP